MNIVGRDHQLHLLRLDLLRCLNERRGGGAILAGPVGVGRTALLLRLAEEAAALGADVRHATCSPLERDFPLSAIHQLLHAAPLDPAEAERRDELLAEGALVAGTCSGRLTAPVVQGLCDLLARRAAGGPTVLLVDDAQHLDAQSLEVLLYTARRIRTAPVLIVPAERDATVPAPASRSMMLADLAQQDHFRRLLAATLTAARHNERVVLLTEACTVLDGCGDQAELMRALEDLAAALHGLGESDLARVAERRAAYLRAAIGLAPPEPAAGPAAAAEPAEAAGPGPAELTESEQRVAVLAAQGLTNRQISGRLYVTVSTVEQHLTRIYRKLGVTRRADLRVRLGAAALPS
jgi:DNA-binding NarL/FixJ family response regulator